jgi:hypothetical protein
VPTAGLLTAGLLTAGLLTAGLPTAGLLTAGLPTAGLLTAGLPTAGQGWEGRSDQDTAFRTTSSPTYSNVKERSRNSREPAAPSRRPAEIACRIIPEHFK